MNRLAAEVVWSGRREFTAFEFKVYRRFPVGQEAASRRLQQRV
jgi:hypothetical protein